MVARVLVTTADEGTWPDNEPILFLGEWCRLHERRHVWEKLDSEIVPYHWNDRAKLHSDYLYLRELHDELLTELAQALNAVHSVNHSVRYWRTLLGMWLGTFVQIVFDRWSMIERALSEHSVIGVNVRSSDATCSVPADTPEFFSSFIEDSWNERICGELLVGWTTAGVSKVPQGPDLLTVSLGNVRPAPHSLRSTFARGLASLSGFLARPDEAFLMGTYLPRQHDIRLQLALRQLPKVWQWPERPRAIPAVIPRKWRLSGNTGGRFGEIARAMIPQHIPSVFMEGYSHLVQSVASLKWPRKPKVIFTSAVDGVNDVFRAWVAEKAEAGGKLIVGQHGGSYGMSLCSFSEDNQLSVSDTWLSWGWTSSENEIQPVGNLKVIGRQNLWNSAGNALLVEIDVPRYSAWLHSVPIASQRLDYFDEQTRFVNALPPNIRDNLTIRLASTAEAWGWSTSKRWNEACPGVALDSGLNPIAPLIARSRVCVSTSNTTTFLETLALNIPTIVFWNPVHWELRKDAVPFVDGLRAAGIFFDNAEEAAEKLVAVWDTVPDWWQGIELQGARERFCRRFSRTGPNQRLILAEILKEASGAAQ